MSMSIPYEADGRIHQKRRTRDALVTAARELVPRERGATAHDASTLARSRPGRTLRTSTPARPSDQLDRGSTRAAPRGNVRARDPPPHPRDTKRHGDRSLRLAY